MLVGEVSKLLLVLQCLRHHKCIREDALPLGFLTSKEQSVRLFLTSRPISQESDLSKEHTLPPCPPRVTRRTLRSPCTLPSTLIRSWIVHQPPGVTRRSRRIRLHLSLLFPLNPHLFRTCYPLQTTRSHRHRPTKLGHYSHANLTPLRRLSSWKISRGRKGLDLLTSLTLVVLPTLTRIRNTTTGTTWRRRTTKERTRYSSLLRHHDLRSHPNPRIPFAFQQEVSQLLHLHTLDMAPGVRRGQLVLSTGLWKHCSKTPLYHQRRPTRASPHFLPLNAFFPWQWITITRLGIVQASHPSCPHAHTQVLTWPNPGSWMP